TLKLSDTIDTSTVESEHTFAIFAEAHATIKDYVAQTNLVIILEKQKKILTIVISNVYYCKYNKEFAITKSCLEHNHDSCSDTTKFSSIMRKLDQNDLGLIEKLHNNGLRTKNIFLVLNSVSTKYIYKPDIYNAISDIALKNTFNDERDQDDEFMQAIFWAYRNAVSEFAVGKNVLIFDATYKTNRFSIPLVLQQLSKTLIIVTGSVQVAMIITDWELALMIAINKQAYESFLYQNKYKHNEANMGLEKLKSVYLCFAFELFIKQQAELAKSESYKVFKSGLMQQVSEYVIEHSKIPELSQKGPNITQSSIFETVSISDTTNYDEIKMLAIKHSRGCPPNNEHIHSADENKISSEK
ncbi:15201_t:CDS:2, partial [Gigaspora margarita]